MVLRQRSWPQNTDLKDFDIWKKAGGRRKAHIESIPIEVNDGELSISFQRQAENPAIKAIEIVPQGGDDESETIRIKAGESSPFTDKDGNVYFFVRYDRLL